MERRDLPDSVDNAYQIVCRLLENDPERLAFFKNELKKKDLINADESVNPIMKRDLASVLIGSLLVLRDRIEEEEKELLKQKQQPLFERLKTAEEGEKPAILSELRRLKDESIKTEQERLSSLGLIVKSLKDKIAFMPGGYSEEEASEQEVAVLKQAQQDPKLSSDNFKNMLVAMELFDPGKQHDLVCALAGGLLISQKIIPPAPVPVVTVTQPPQKESILKWLLGAILGAISTFLGLGPSETPAAKTGTKTSKSNKKSKDTASPSPYSLLGVTPEVGKDKQKESSLSATTSASTSGTILDRSPVIPDHRPKGDVDRSSSASKQKRK